MARDVLSTLASSVPIERFFSIGSLTMTTKRTRLKDDTLKAMMCISAWPKSKLKEKIWAPFTGHNCRCQSLAVFRIPKIKYKNLLMQNNKN